VCIPTLERFLTGVFTNMHLNTVPDMCVINFEIMKEVSTLRMRHDDEFYHMSELQYFVTCLHGIDVAKNILVSQLL
jgi:hypothetical protein